MRKLCGGEEALIVTSSAPEAGLSCWRLRADEPLFRPLTCTCPRNGLVYLGHRSFAASQIQRMGSVGCGEIFFWALNKNKVDRRYPVEPIISLACTVNGVYMAGGGLSGKVYLWEVSSWNQIATWTGHLKGVSCLVFSDDDSLLLSAADDGTICVWPLIRILDTSKSSSPTPALPNLFLYKWSGHRDPITMLVSGAGNSNAIVVSSSLDQTCKVWGLGLGKLLHSIRLQSAISSIVLDPTGQFLYAGTEDGKISVHIMSRWLLPVSCGAGSLSTAFSAHRSSVTALAISLDERYLISGSEDRFVRIWDIFTGNLVKELHVKGPVTNILVIPEHIISGVCKVNEQKLFRGRTSPAALLEPTKISGLRDSIAYRDPLVLLPPLHSKFDEVREGKSSATALEKQLHELEHESTPAALELKIKIMSEKKACAYKTGEDFSQEYELLKSLASEMQSAPV